MRIIAKSTLVKKGKEYGPRAQKQLNVWYEEVKEAEWRNSRDILRRFNEAKIINNEIVVFKICRNDYRLVVKVRYQWQEVYIKFFGTHAEYDRLDLKDL